MGEVQKISKETVISIGLAVTLLSGFFYMGKLAERIDNVVTTTERHETLLKDLPTRTEFQTLTNSVTDGFTDLKNQLANHNAN